MIREEQARALRWLGQWGGSVLHTITHAWPAMHKQLFYLHCKMCLGYCVQQGGKLVGEEKMLFPRHKTLLGCTSEG